MGRPKGCNCHCQCCYCRTWTLLEWSGDRDFTGDLDIRNYPQYQAAMLNLKSQTSMLWRIRYNPDQAFIEWLADNKILTSGSYLNGTFFVDFFPFTSEAAFFSGPVRDGIIYGLDSVPAGRDPVHPGDPYADSVNPYFDGGYSLKYYNTNGSAFPVNWTVEDWPTNPVAIPWVLELGCARCPCLDAVSWPDHTRFFYDPEVSFSPLDPGGIGSAAVDPEASTLTSETTDGSCQAITDDDLQSIFWPGDEAEPDHSATCPPDCIVWVSDMWPLAPLLLLYGVAGGARSIPGASFPSDAPPHPALALAAAGGTAVQLDGWSGRFAGDDVARAARGDSAAIANVDCIYLVDVYNTFGAMQQYTWSYSLAESDVEWLVDWLDLGGKTLIVDAPWKHVSSTFAQGANPSGLDQPNISIGNDFLGWLGSSLSLYAIEDGHSPGYPYRALVSLDCVSTESHALAPVPETLFSGVGWPEGSSRLTAVPLAGGGSIDPVVTGISGGSALYEYNCVIRTVVAPLQTGPGAASDGDETHPVIAVEELGNGSRIIAGSISISSKVHAEERRGLSHVPGIGNLIVRSVQSS